MTNDPFNDAGGSRLGSTVQILDNAFMPRFAWIALVNDWEHAVPRLIAVGFRLRRADLLKLDLRNCVVFWISGSSA